MKKLVFSFIGLSAIVAAVVFNVSIGLRGETLSDLALANIEALARNENSNGSITCYSTYRTTSKKNYEDVWTITKCNGCCEVDVFEYKDKGTCTNSGGLHFC